MENILWTEQTDLIFFYIDIQSTQNKIRILLHVSNSKFDLNFNTVDGVALLIISSNLFIKMCNLHSEIIFFDQFSTKIFFVCSPKYVLFKLGLI